MMEKILCLTEQAFQKGELIDLLVGTSPYYISDSEFNSGYQATNYGAVLKYGIYGFYERNPQIKSVFEISLVQMGGANSFQFYVAFAYLRTQIFREHRNISPFTIEQQTIKKITEKFASHKIELEKGITDMQGIYHPTALADILRWNKATKDFYGLELLEGGREVRL